MKKRALITAFAATAVLAAAQTASAASTFLFDPASQYTGISDSPFHGASNLRLQNFESGLANMPGLKKVKQGSVKGPGQGANSVAGDSAGGGHSFSSGNRKSLNFRFKQNANHGLPTMAGLVWTNGNENARITFKAWDHNKNLLGKIRVNVSDLVGSGDQHRFFGIANHEGGISRIQIASTFANFEIDHLQFAYGPVGSFAVVPVPPALALGLVGLAGVAMIKRMKRRASSRS
jgi:hypothetical protein